MESVNVLLVGMCVVAGPLTVSLRNQGGGIREVPHCDCFLLFLCCLKSVSGSFRYSYWSLQQHLETVQVVFLFYFLHSSIALGCRFVRV